VTELLALVHAAATWFMTGLIWFVQVVHYPLFGLLDEDHDGGARWPAYSRAHQARTTMVVGPVMLVELSTTIGLLVLKFGPLTIAGAVLLTLVWASTFFVQVPLHARLERGHDPAVVRRLVATNWARTALWTARGAIALVLLSPA